MGNRSGRNQSKPKAATAAPAPASSATEPAVATTKSTASALPSTAGVTTAAHIPESILPETLLTHVKIPKDLCPALHKLIDAKAPVGLPAGIFGFSSFFDQQLTCNICRQPIPGETSVHSCEQCDYDVCHSCFESAASIDWKPRKCGDINREQPAMVQQTTMNKIGVSLDHLRTFKVENAWGKDADPSVYQVCEAIIKQSTCSSLSSYCERLSSDPSTMHLVGEADFFVSYAWSYSWNYLMGALKNETGFVWIDVATVNQHFSESVNLEQWLHTFGDAIAGIGRVVLVVSPWDDPIPARRSWCAFEMYTATERNVPVTVAFPPEERENFMQALGSLGNGSVFQSIIGSINVDTANATKIEDEKAIRELIRKAGVVKVNNVVLLAVKSWLGTLAEEAIAKAEIGDSTTPPETAYQIFDNAGSLFEIVLQDKERALQLYEKSMHKAAEIYPEDHPAVVMEMCNMATILQHKAETRAKAREYYEVGIARLEKKGGTRKTTNIVTLLSNLSLLAAEEKQMDEALVLNREAVDIATELFTREDPRTQTMISNYLGLLCDARKFDEALPLAEEIVRNAERYGRMPEDSEVNSDPFVAMAYNNLAEILRKMQRFETAEMYFLKAIAIHERVYGKTSGSCVDVRYNLAKLWKAQESHMDEVQELEREIGKTVIVD